MKPIGYLALVERFGLVVNPPPGQSFLLERGRRRSLVADGTRSEFYPPRDDPGELWTDQLRFALKHEGVNLEVLAALFRAAPERDLAEWVRASPTGRHARIAWFLFEWLTGGRLPLPDVSRGNYVPALDPARYFALPRDLGATLSRRHRVIDNLPGMPAWCPLVRRTERLEADMRRRLDLEVRRHLARYPEDLIRRAAQYLYLKETKSSYAIEHLEPDRRRAARFVELLRQAGQTDCLTEAGLVAVQRQIVDERYAAGSFRDFQNYIGQSVAPGHEVVHYVPPRPEDLGPMMHGWMEACRRLIGGGVDPVVAATVAGFGFVFLHPFEDGNGRLHRFLIHHVLAATGFTPDGVLFPVSALMLKQLHRYDALLESWSRPVMRNVEYVLSDRGELTVRNETAPLYRYPDMTWLAEQMFAFVRDTVEIEFVAELDYLGALDSARKRMRNVVDMPDRRLDLFVRLCLQGAGRLPRGKRRLFRELGDREVEKLERIAMRAVRRIASPGTTGRTTRRRKPPE